MTVDRHVPVDHLASLISSYRESRRQARRWKGRSNRLLRIIVAELTGKQANVGTINGKPVVRWTVSERDRIDTTLLREENPALAAKYSAPSPTSRLELIDEVTTEEPRQP